METLLRARSVQAEGKLARVSFALRLNDPCENRSAHLDIETPESLGRQMIWETGEYFAEILDISSQRSSYLRSGAAQTRHGIHAASEAFLGQFGQLVSPS